MQRAMKWFLGLLASAAFLCGGFVVLHGSLPPASINAWLPAGSLTAARTGAASVLLQDGRLLITGGNGASGVLATTDILNPSSGFTPGPPMNLARSSHVAVVLLDGRVLVAGGTDASGRASQSAELFDPAANSWSASGPLMVGRSGATATLLPSGQVLIAGGTANGAALASLELFDPNANTFSLVAGVLSSARENHAAALLPDGRVLIAGGWDGTTNASSGNANVLASTDIFDPTTGAVAPGPALAAPRMNFTATRRLMAAWLPSAEPTARTILLQLLSSFPGPELLPFRARSSPRPARGIWHSCFRTTATFWWLEEFRAAPPSPLLNFIRPGPAQPALPAPWLRLARAPQVARCLRPFSAPPSASTAR